MLGLPYPLAIRSVFPLLWSGRGAGSQVTEGRSCVTWHQCPPIGSNLIWIWVDGLVAPAALRPPAVLHGPLRGCLRVPLETAASKPQREKK